MFNSSVCSNLRVKSTISCLVFQTCFTDSSKEVFQDKGVHSNSQTNWDWTTSFLAWSENHPSKFNSWDFHLAAFKAALVFFQKIPSTFTHNSLWSFLTRFLFHLSLFSSKFETISDPCDSSLIHLVFDFQTISWYQIFQLVLGSLVLETSVLTLESSDFVPFWTLSIAVT